MQGIDDEESQQIAGEAYRQLTMACLVIDMARGTRSRRGFAGRGARFYVDPRSKTWMFLKYGVL